MTRRQALEWQIHVARRNLTTLEARYAELLAGKATSADRTQAAMMVERGRAYFADLEAVLKEYDLKTYEEDLAKTALPR